MEKFIISSNLLLDLISISNNNVDYIAEDYIATVKIALRLYTFDVIGSDWIGQLGLNLG